MCPTPSPSRFSSKPSPFPSQSRAPLIEPCKFPSHLHGDIRLVTPMKQPTELGFGGHWLLESSFPTGGARGLGETLYGAVLTWGEARWSMPPASYPSNAVCLVSMMREACFSLTPCSRRLSVVSCSWSGC